jgi:hypothetical protein
VEGIRVALDSASGLEGQGAGNLLTSDLSARSS